MRVSKHEPRPISNRGRLMTNTQTHVAVLMGGWSSEREVSLRSGEACAAALEAQGYRATRLDVGRDVATRLTELRPDVCFNALHGRFGEDGCIQGVLETLGIPYTHSGVLASALAMHKERAKTVMRAAGVPVAEAVVLTRQEAARAHAMPPPYVIKPVTEGSSVGVFIVREDQRHPPQELHAADWTLGEELMVERYIPGRELTCAVMGEDALGVIEIRPAEGLTTPRNTPREARSTCFRRRFYQMFTNWYRSCPWRPIGHWAAVASAVPISDSMIGAAARGK